MRRSREGPAPPGLFDADTFLGFGPSRFIPAGERPDAALIRRRGRGEVKLRDRVRALAPKVPGVYGMIDGRGRIVYVGKAKCLRARLLSYFRPDSRPPKARKIVEHTRVLVWEQANDEFAALLRELELIRRFRPRFNVLGQPGPRRYVYLCLGKSPAAYVYLTREATGKEIGCYGPLVGRGRARDAVRRLNDWFRLRDCPSTYPLAFADQTELFPEDRGPKCLRYDIGTCLGPCGGTCTRGEYSAAVRAVKAFLDGKSTAPLDTLAKQMAAAAAELRFEQAMAARDRLQLLTWLSDRLAFLRAARRANSFVYPLSADGGRPVWYLIHHGEVQAAVREPATDVERRAAAGVIARVFGTVAPPGGIDDKCVDSVLLVTAWFRRYRDEKAKLLAKADALGRCETNRPAPGASEGRGGVEPGGGVTSCTGSGS